MQDAVGIRFAVQRKRAALANQLVLDSAGFFGGPIAPLNLRGASHARNGFHPLFKGRRHGTSSRIFGMSAKVGMVGANPRSKSSSKHTPKRKSLRHGSIKRKASAKIFLRHGNIFTRAFLETADGKAIREFRPIEGTEPEICFLQIARGGNMGSGRLMDGARIFCDGPFQPHALPRNSIRWPDLCPRRCDVRHKCPCGSSQRKPWQLCQKCNCTI